MNCFQHPNESAVVCCKGCGKPLCQACSQQSFGNQTGVCSDACAGVTEADPDPEDLPDTPFSRAFASIYTTLLAIVAGVGLGGFVCAFGTQWTIERLKHPPLLSEYSRYHHHDPRLSIFRVLCDLGITDWRAEFGIGAVVGIGLALLWLKQGSKMALAAGLAIYLVLQLWVAWK